MDIEEETLAKANKDQEQLVVLRQKNPYLFDVFDERQKLCFKSLQWKKQ